MPTTYLPVLIPDQLAMNIDRPTFERLCIRREALKQELFDAPSNSPLAHDLANKLSIVVGTIDAYLAQNGGEA